MSHTNRHCTQRIWSDSCRAMHLSVMPQTPLPLEYLFAGGDQLAHYMLPLRNDATERVFDDTVRIAILNMQRRHGRGYDHFANPSRMLVTRCPIAWAYASSLSRVCGTSV